MSVFFVGGVNRSGTTLFQSILCSDKTTNPLIHEASYIKNIIEAYVFGKQKFEEHNKYYFSSIDEMRDFTAGWLKSFLDKTRDRYSGAEHLVLKHPPLTPRFPDLFELLKCINENPKFYIIIRDPRDVAASLVRVGERLREQGESEGNTLPRNMNLLGNYYMQCYMPALMAQNAAYQDSVTMIKYEDLVTRPHDIIKEIRKTSNLNLEEFNSNNNWINDNLDYNHLELNKNAWLSDLWGKKLSNSKVGSYKEILKPEEIALLEKVCDGPLKTFGYI